MPVAVSNPTAPSPLKPNVVKIATQESSGIVVDTRYTPLSSLLTYIEGASWTTDYYSQVINKDNDLRGQDVGESAIYQQYSCIKGLELKVVSPLQQSQDPESKRMIVSGTATIYPFLKANEGDMFAADVGDGREGVFRIKTTERKSYLREAVYQIEYDLVYYSDADKVRRVDLDNKSINTYYYRKDFLQHGQNPLLIQSDNNTVNELTQKYSEIIKDYFGWFFNKDTNALIVPGQLEKTYDHYLTQCVLGILTTTDAIEILNVRRLNVDADPYVKQPQLFQVLFLRDKDLLINSNAKMGTVSTRYFAKDPFMQGIVYSGAKRLVYPKNPDMSLINANDAQALTPDDFDFNIVPTSIGDINQAFAIDNLEPASLPAIIYKVNVDDYYVFSQSFYKDTDGKSLLEILAMDYLENKAIDANKLLEIVKTYKYWGGLEKFYYLPIVLILIKASIRGL